MVGLYIRSNPCSIFIQTQCSLRRHAQCILLSSNCFIFLNHFCSVLALFTPIKDTRAFKEIALVVYWGPIERRAPQWMKVLSRSFFLVSCSSSRPLREKCQLCGWFCHWSVRTPSTSPLPRQPGPLHLSPPQSTSVTRSPGFEDAITFVSKRKSRDIYRYNDQLVIYKDHFTKPFFFQRWLMINIYTRSGSFQQILIYLC